MCRRGAMAGFLVMFVPVFVFAVFLELAPAWHFESLTDPVLKNRVETIQIGQRQFALAMIKKSEREAILSSSDEENPLTFIVSTDDYRFVSEQGGVAHWKSL
jgi:hypothetical protein